VRLTKLLQRTASRNTMRCNVLRYPVRAAAAEQRPLGGRTMGILKGKSEGGAGGKRGHSNMDHWGYTDEVKTAARKRRRLDSKEIIARETNEMDENGDQKLKAEARRATRMLKSKTVKAVRRHSAKEVLIEFTDGTRLYVSTPGEFVDVSIT